MIFVDSSFLIAAADASDQFHHRAGAIMPQLNGKKLISELVAAETVTGVGMRLGSRAAQQVFVNLVYDPTVTTIFSSRRLFERSLQLYMRYGGRLSFADAVSVQIMYDQQVRRIASFDADFDNIRGITRVH